MFDLEKSIAEWRRQMQAAGIKSPVPLDELEMHLREDVQQQANSGLNEQQSFELAAQKIGQPQAVRNEFNKIGGMTDERRQKFWRAYFIVFSIINSVLCPYCLLKLEMSPALRTSGFIATALASGFLWMAPNLHKYLPLVRSKRTRTVLQTVPLVAWMIFGCVFVNLVLPLLDPTQGQLVVMFIWLLTPMAVISALGHGLGEAARKQTAPANA
jgi:hypothetical protein